MGSITIFNFWLSLGTRGKGEGFIDLGLAIPRCSCKCSRYCRSAEEDEGVGALVSGGKRSSSSAIASLFEGWNLSKARRSGRC